MTQAVILDATRTPFGRFGGALKDVKAPELAAHCIRTLVERDGIDPGEVDDVILGEVLQAGVGQLPSRQALIAAGLPVSTPSFLINKVCASGFRAITLAEQLIRTGDHDLIVAGGMESMSNTPYYDFAARWGQRMGDTQLVDGMIRDGLWDAFDDCHMASFGGATADAYEIGRAEMDRFAARSQQRWAEAQQAGRFAEEVTPIPVPKGRGQTVLFDTDEFPRPDTTEEKLRGLAPIFGTTGVTAGNAPGVNDGAGVAIVCSEERARALGRPLLARILGHAHVAVKPSDFPIAPAYAVQKLLAQTGRSVDDIHLFECNEAFAAVVLACGQIVGWDEERVNTWGGAIAMGHPIGASGARIIMTLAYQLRARGGGLGVASICSGTGQGDAVLLEVA